MANLTRFATGFSVDHMNHHRQKKANRYCERVTEGQSMWQRLVTRDFRFDPERYFPEEKAYLNPSDPDPQRQILTADDQRREAQKGHQSLKEKYGK